ncbi:hydroxymethylbilane synthase [Barrientosiimonas marina]|uniref:Porphobilinogen deaminase n=1 Tax=Lentibacillus kimchii TaxID=1542911 RepID=A0ABW2UZ51_9BACI
MRQIVAGTRKSNLALTQTDWVIDQLKQAGITNDIQVEKIVTQGDRILNVTLSKVGGKALFVKEIEKAMFNKEIDMAVHSMKDVPSEMPEGLVITTIPVREDHRDAWIAKDDIPLKDLPAGSIVGTSSLRRKAQILAERPDLEISWIRGNIESRIRKLYEEDYDAIVLAVSGLKRVGLSEELITEYLEPDVCVPSVGQGALAIECREEDYELRDLLALIHDQETAQTVTAERTLLKILEGSCSVPVGGHARLENGDIHMTAFVGTTDGETLLRENVQGTDPEEVGAEAANKLIGRGAKDIIEQIKEELDS